MTVQTIELSAIQYFLWVLRNLNVSVVNSCLHISYLVPSQDLQQPFFFSRDAASALTRMSLKLLAIPSQIIDTFSPFHILFLLLIVGIFQIAQF